MNQELEQFFAQLPPELQEKIQAIPDDQKKMEVLSTLYQKYVQTQGQQGQQSLMGRYGMRAEEGANPSQERIPVEAERNENVTVQDGMSVPTDGGYLEEKSSNPITGQTTYEIPDNKYNQTHEQGGVDTELKEGDVVNSDKLKIPFEFKVGTSNFKNKTFKDASDKISSLEKNAEKKLNNLVKDGKADEITEQSFSINFAKYGKMREELNTIQETVLEMNKQEDSNKEVNSIMARYGTNVKSLDKAKNNYDEILTGYIDNKRGFKKENVLKAEKGLNAKLNDMQELLSYARENNLSPQEINEKIISTGMLNNNYTNSPQKSSSQKSFVKPFSYNPSSDTIQQFKDVIASQESRSYKNPYMAIGGLKEKDAMVPFESTKGKRASSAIGKYQFLWTTWKNDIKKQTGIEDPDEFRNNPSAQEQFMDWYTKNDLLPKATRLKQKYQIPMNVYEIMGALHLEGEQGFLKKYQSGQMNKSTMAGKFKNASTEQYSGAFSQFPEEQEMRYGGKLYAHVGVKASTPGLVRLLPGYEITDLDPALKDSWTDYQGNRIDEQGNLITNNNTLSPIMNNISTTPISKPFSLWGGDNNPPNQPRLNLPNYTLEDVDYLNKELFQGQAKTEKQFQELLYGKYKQDTGNPVYRKYNGQIDQNNLAKIDGRLGDDPELAINYYLDKLKGQSVPLPGSNYTKAISPSKPPLSFESYLSRGPEPEDQEEIGMQAIENNDPSTSEGIGFQNDQAKWWEKVNYGINKSLPYANALSLLMEKKINPTLQQKRARYTPLNTDVDIQPQMNEMQRMYNRNQSDSRGNPSLRAARLAQISSNITGNTNQLLSGKYNQEQQLENQEIMRRDGYFNSLDDYNRQLMKQYETEVLQTDENMRQQRRGASDYMANLKLRESEQNKATALALSNTMYDYNPITGKMDVNQRKADENVAYKYQMFKYQNLLQQQQKIQEELALTKNKDERKPLEEQLKDMEKKLKDLETPKTTTSKKLGGRVKKENTTIDKFRFSNYS